MVSYYKNNNENEDSNDKFMADTPLNEIDTKKIYIYKTEFFYDNEIKKGGAVVFDETGIHRGSKTSLNDRKALRFFYKKI